MKSSLAVSVFLVLCAVSLLSAEAASAKPHSKRHHAKKVQHDEPTDSGDPQTKVLSLAEPVMKEARALSNDIVPALRAFKPQVKALVREFIDMALDPEKRTASNVRSLVTSAAATASDVYTRVLVPNQQKFKRLLTDVVSVAADPSTRALARSTARSLVESFRR